MDDSSNKNIFVRDTNYRTKLLFYFLYISQKRTTELMFKSRHSCIEKFEEFRGQYYEPQDWKPRSGLGREAEQEFFENHENKKYLERKDRFYIITELGEKYAHQIENDIFDDDRHNIFDFFDLEFPEDIVDLVPSSKNENKTYYPVPDMNAPFMKNEHFYWYYREESLINEFKQTFSDFFQDPWNKNAGIIYGSSNSGKTSFLRFIEKFNTSNIMNAWSKQYKEILKLKDNTASIYYTDNINTIEDLTDKIRELIIKVTARVNKENEDKKDNKVFLNGQNLALKIESLENSVESLNALLITSNLKYLLIIDQCEKLFENLLNDTEKRKIFFREFLLLIPQLSQLGLILAISQEYYYFFDQLLQKVGQSNKILFPKFIINKLPISLLKTIIVSLSKDQSKNESRQYKHIHINENQIPLISNVLREEETFSGTNWNILIHQLIEKYEDKYSLDITIPELSENDYRKLIDSWREKKILDRKNSSIKSFQYLTYQFLLKFYEHSPKFNIPFTSEELNTWYKMLLEMNQLNSERPLASILKELIKDGLIRQDDENSYRISHQTVLGMLKSSIPDDQMNLIKLRQLWDAEIQINPIPTNQVFLQVISNPSMLASLILEPLSFKKLSLGLIEYSDSISTELSYSIPKELIKQCSSMFCVENKVDILQYTKLLKSISNLQNQDLVNLFYDTDIIRLFDFVQWTKYIENKHDYPHFKDFFQQLSTLNSNVTSGIVRTTIKNFEGEYPLPLLINRVCIENLNDLSTISIFPKEELEKYDWQIFNSLPPLSIINIIDVFLPYCNGQILNKNDFISYVIVKISTNLNWIHFLNNNLSLLALNSVLQFNEKLGKFPADFFKYDWSRYLKSAWNINPIEVIKVLLKNTYFSQNYFEHWPKNGYFPELEDFIATKSLCYFNFFIGYVLPNLYVDDYKIKDFFKLYYKNNDFLKKLDDSTYLPRKNDYLILLKQHVEGISQNDNQDQLLPPNYLNSYQKTLDDLYKILGLNNTFIDYKTFFSNDFNKERTNYSWEVSLSVLPNLLDVVILLFYKNNSKVPVILSRLTESINNNATLWNNLFNTDFYLKSIEDYYGVPREFLHITTLYPLRSVENIIDFHMRTLEIFLYLIINNIRYKKIINSLFNKTGFLDNIFLNNEHLATDNIIRKIKLNNSFSLANIYQNLPEKHFLFSDWYTHIDYFLNKRLFAWKEDFKQELFNISNQHPVHIIISFLNTNDPNTVIFWGKLSQSIDIINIVKAVPYTYLLDNYPKKTTWGLIHLLQKKKYDYTDNQKIWKEFIEKIFETNDETLLPFSINSLEKIEPLYYRLGSQKNTEKYWKIILREIPWSDYILSFDDESLTNLYEKYYLSNSFYDSRKKEIFSSFINGIVKVFPKWVNALKVREKVFYPFIYLISETPKIKNPGQKEKWLENINKEIINCSKENIITQENISEYALRYLSFLIEVGINYNQLHDSFYHVLNNLFIKKELFSNKIFDFSDINQFLLSLEKLNRRNVEQFSEIYNKFIYLLENVIHCHLLPIYSREEDWIANILNNNNPKFQFFLINEKFPLKLLQCILEMVKNESYVLQSFQNDLNKLLSYNNLKLYHGLLNENFYQNLFEELPWEIIIKTIITHYIYDIKFNTSNFDSKVFDYLVKSNKFSNIDWTNIGEDIEVHNFAIINKFFDSPETLTQKILQNPTFWKRNWSHILKSMIHDNNSSDSKFYELIRKFSKEILVQQFIRQHHSDLELYEKKYSQD